MEYEDLINRLEGLKGKVVTYQLLDKIFEEYGWLSMGIDVEFPIVYYTECLIDGREIRLHVNIVGEDLMVIKEVEKLYF